MFETCRSWCRNKSRGKTALKHGSYLAFLKKRLNQWSSRAWGFVLELHLWKGIEENRWDLVSPPSHPNVTGEWKDRCEIWLNLVSLSSLVKRYGKPQVLDLIGRRFTKKILQIAELGLPNWSLLEIIYNSCIMIYSLMHMYIHNSVHFIRKYNLLCCLKDNTVCLCRLN